MIKVLLKMKLNVVILFNGINRRYVMSKSKKYLYISYCLVFLFCGHVMMKTIQLDKILLLLLRMQASILVRLIMRKQ